MQQATSDAGVGAGPPGLPALPNWARPRPLWAAGVSLLALAALVLVLWRAREVVAWTAVALLLALTLDLPVRSLQRRGLPRGGAVLIVIAGALALLVTMLVFLAPKLAVQMRALMAERAALVHQTGGGELVPWVSEHLHSLHRLGGLMAGHGGDLTGSLLHLLRVAAKSVFAALTVFVLAGYMLVSGAALVNGLLQWLPDSRRGRWQELASNARWVVGRYAAAVLIRAALIGAASAIMLALLRVPYFLPVGLTVTMLGVLPLIGPILAAVVVVGAASAVGPDKALVALALFVLLQQADSHLLSPVIQRYTVQMNPLITMLSSLLGMAGGGLLGAIVALPLAAIVQLLVRERFRERAAAGTTAGAG